MGEMQHDRHQQRAPSSRAAPEPVAPAIAPANPLLAEQRAVGNQAVQRHLRSGAISPRLILGQQQTLGNQAVQRLLRSAVPAPTPAATGATVQRRPAEAANIARLRELLDDGDEDGAIRQMGRLEPDEADRVLRDGTLLYLAVDTFNDAEMARAMAALRGGTLFWRLSWMHSEGSDWDKVKARIRATPSADEKTDLYGRQRMRDFFVSICNNQEMAEAVQLLGGTLKQKLGWMVAEGTNDDLVFKAVRLAPETELGAVASDNTLMEGLRGEMSGSGYSALRQMLSRGLLAWEHVERGYTEQHYERSDESDPTSAWELQEFGGTGAYEMQYTRTELLIMVRIKLKGEPTTAAQRASWVTGIQNRWNGHFHADNGRRRLTIRFLPSFTSDDAHHTVKIHPGPVVREDQTNWYAGPNPGDTTTGDTAAHEFGHMVGLEDEYRLTREDFTRLIGRAPTNADLANPADPAAGYSAPGLMTSGQGNVQGRHLRPFMAWLNSHRVPGEPPYRLEAGA